MGVHWHMKFCNHKDVWKRTLLATMNAWCRNHRGGTRCWHTPIIFLATLGRRDGVRAKCIAIVVVEICALLAE